MHYYKIILQYDGTNYHGWQTQPGLPTIQEELTKTLKFISKSDRVGVLGSGRTDAGVHALEQVARITIPTSIESNLLLTEINNHLPNDIRCRNVEECDYTFRPDAHLLQKEYIYLFTNKQICLNPFQVGYIANFAKTLNIDLITQGCQILQGEHDFFNFSNCDKSKSSVRTIYSCTIDQIRYPSNEMLPEHYQIRFVGNGFLKYMVRYMVGALWKLGSDQINLNDLKKALNQKSTSKISRPAPVEGLYLSKISY